MPDTSAAPAEARPSRFEDADTVVMTERRSLREVMDERFNALLQVVDSRTRELAKATETLREVMDQRFDAQDKATEALREVMNE
ncbi:MAG: hypothetical protein OXM02_12900 [Bacteroidota bacterium]|nr:hypothetical protein [Bacteroidota bacterium]MDE2835398.1 hypothetical protein [Bacteroidota bacterium]